MTRGAEYPEALIYTVSLSNSSALCLLNFAKDCANAILSESHSLGRALSQLCLLDQAFHNAFIDIGSYNL